MKIGRADRSYVLIIIFIYVSILVVVDFFHNHPADIFGNFHDDCPACLWNYQTKTVDNSDLRDEIIKIICNDLVSKYICPDDDSRLIYQIVIDFIRKRGPPEKLTISVFI